MQFWRKEMFKVNAKEYLSQAYYIDQRIDCKMEQIKSLRELATKANSVISDMPKGNGNKQIMEKNIAAIVELEHEIDNDVSNLINLKREIINTIRNIDNSEYKTLLELRYICFNKWETIALSMKYGRDTIYKIHQQALKKISQKLGSKIQKNQKNPLESGNSA